MILCAILVEGDEYLDLSNVGAWHAWCVWISFNKDSVVLGRAFPPRWQSMDVFTMHTFGATDVARCIELSNRRMVDGDLLKKYR